MIDIITTRVQEAYTWIIAENVIAKPKSNGTSNNYLNGDLATIKRFNEENRRRTVVQLKEREPDLPLTPRTKPATELLPSIEGLACSDCAKISNAVSVELENGATTVPRPEY